MSLRVTDKSKDTNKATIPTFPSILEWDGLVDSFSPKHTKTEPTINSNIEAGAIGIIYLGLVNSFSSLSTLRKANLTV